MDIQKFWDAVLRQDAAGGGSSDVTYPSDRGWGRPDSGWDMEAEEERSTKGFKSGKEVFSQ